MDFRQKRLCHLAQNEIHDPCILPRVEGDGDETSESFHRGGCF